MEDLDDNLIDNLIKIAEKKLPKDVVPEKKVVDLNEVQKFIITFGIDSGRNKVTSRAIYDAYKDWSDNPLKKAGFMQEFSKYFISEHKRTHNYYNLNIKAWQLTMKAKEYAKNKEKDKEE